MKKFLSIVIFLVSLLPGILSGSTYLVDVTVECENEEAAYSAYLKFLPLPQGKEVAFSCRWDDSSLGHAALVPLLNHTDAAVREHAAQALGKMGLPKARTFLLHRKAEEKEAGVLKAIADALQHIEVRV